MTVIPEEPDRRTRARIARRMKRDGPFLRHLGNLASIAANGRNPETSLYYVQRLADECASILTDLASRAGRATRRAA